MSVVRKSTILVLLLLTAYHASAQVGLRTNLAYDATLTPNLGAEIRLDSAWTFALSAGLNAWDIDKATNKKWRHVLVSPGFRHYWGRQMQKPAHRSLWGLPSEQSRRVNYLEFGPMYSHFNVGNVKFPFGLYGAVNNRRLQGDLAALSAKYGWSWIMARDWRIEAEAGIAVGYAWFREYDCATCGTYYGRGDRIFLLPQLGVNVVYIIN